MKDDVMKRECLSALADGELQGDEFAQAMARLASLLPAGIGESILGPGGY